MLWASAASYTSFANVRMLPAESPAVSCVTASVVACSITWIEPPAFALELPAVALTTAKTRTAAATAAAGTSRRFISPLPCREGQDISRRDGAVYPQRPRNRGRLGPAPDEVRQRHDADP